MKSSLSNDELMIEYSNKIIDLLKSIIKNFRHSHNDSNFTISQIYLMTELYFHPGITLNELSNKLSLSKSTVSGIVSRLEKKGSVVRIRPDDNRRIVKLSLSPEILKKGKMLLAIKTQTLAKIIENEDINKIRILLESMQYLETLLKKQ